MSGVAQDSEVTTICPRCGYDLRGTVATWTESCPLAGVCTECGLELSWPEVLQPEKYEPRWCIEFEPRRRRVVRAAFKTFGRSFVPWRFWLEIRMSHPIRWRRLAMYLCLLFLPLVLVYVVCQATVALQVKHRLEDEILAMHAQHPASIAAWQQRLAALPSDPEFLARDPAEQQAWIQQYQGYIASAQRAMTMPPTFEYPDWHAIFHAVFTPSSSELRGQLSWQGVNLKYPPTRWLWHMAFLDDRGLFWAVNQANAPRGQRRLVSAPNVRYWWRRVTLQTAAPLAMGISAVLILPCTFLLLPFSLRRAKVRPGHIARVGTYSLFIVPTVTIVVAIAFWITFMWPATESLLLRPVRQFAIFSPWVLLIAWWSCATPQYLRMKRAWLVVLVMTALTFVMVLVLTAAVDESIVVRLLRAIIPDAWNRW